MTRKYPIITVRTHFEENLESSHNQIRELQSDSEQKRNLSVVRCGSGIEDLCGVIEIRFPGLANFVNKSEKSVLQGVVLDRTVTGGLHSVGHDDTRRRDRREDALTDGRGDVGYAFGDQFSFQIDHQNALTCASLVGEFGRLGEKHFVFTNRNAVTLQYVAIEVWQQVVGREGQRSTGIGADHCIACEYGRVLMDELGDGLVTDGAITVPGHG